MADRSWYLRRGRVQLPPISEDEWEPEAVQEATDASRRRSDALAAAKDVRRTKAQLERQAVTEGRNRLLVLKRELQGILLDATSTEFRRAQASQLLAQVDDALQRAAQQLLTIAQTTYQRATDLGTQQVDQAIYASRIALVASPSIAPDLATAAFENTVDLLSDAMQRFRTRIRVQVRRLATTGANLADETASLARTLDDAGFAAADASAERVLRTELSRTFNGATYGRMRDLADRLPFLRKIWIRVNDSRTRDTHIAAARAYARGRGIPIDEPFAVGASRLQYPSDPSGDAKETINCRCSAAVDFDIAELSQHTASRLTRAFGA